jgi:dGTPase
MEKTARFYETVDDFREPYSRDRDRIVHSRSFRILEYKTQVFINTDGDYFRTRLTHSLEVSQIARTISRTLGLDEALSEAIALSHDLGHTPFGHVGGDELDRVLKAYGNANGFEHNFQSFRVVTGLEQRYKEYNGLNLTYATLEGILKHSAPYDKPFIPDTLKEIFRLDLHPSLEAAVVDHSDEIAYISHDIDDGIQHGLISFETLKESELVCQIRESIGKDGLDERDELFRYRFVSRLISYLITDLIANSRIVNGPIPASEPMPIGFSKEVRTKLLRLKKILFQELYRHREIAKKMYTGKVCIGKLFKAFFDEPRMLPAEYLARIESYGKKERAIADYIASLSDRHALEVYRELYFGK